MQARPGRRGRGWKRPRILVLGLGDLYLRDGGGGVHALRAYASSAPEGVRLSEAASDLRGMVRLFRRAQKVVAFDSLAAGGDAGTIHVVGIHEAHAVGTGESFHLVGLTRIMRRLGRRAPELIVVAVEPLTTSGGTELTTPVMSAVPQMVRAAQAIVSYWVGSAALEATPAARYPHGQPARG
jgi:hydrogenase maturation protease